MTGRRMPDDPEFAALRPGDYYRITWPIDGQLHWAGICPDGSHCNLDRHTVTEHADGTISVDPSIEVKDPEQVFWHGYLKAGVWSAC